MAINGVTFYYLDGNGFGKVLFGLDQNKEKLCNVLRDYTKAGVNWIRLLLVASHFPPGMYHQDNIYFKPQVYIDKVNEFLKLTQTCTDAGPFTIELMLDPRREIAPGYFLDSPHLLFENDKSWYSKWIEGIDYTNTGAIFLPGDIWPCSSMRCYGEEKEWLNPMAYNHGYWIREVFNYLQNKYPDLYLGYEVGLSPFTPEAIKQMALWIEKYTPKVESISAAWYFDLPPGTPWEVYADKTHEMLTAYHSVTSKRLWIDEYGFGVCIKDCPFTEWDQLQYYKGVLGALHNHGSMEYPKFAWVAGRDYPYDGRSYYGLIKSFNNNIPLWNESWDILSMYYKLKKG